MRIVLLGAPGSGKGTQGAVLADRFGITHISSGELLRGHIQNGTDLGRQVEQHMAAGDLVPDDLVLQALAGAALTAASRGGFVLDGFPRNLDQARRAFDAAEETGVTADVVVYLHVPDDVARDRLAARNEGRPDDGRPEVIERRLQEFHQQTEPLLDFYRKRGLLTTIDATGDPQGVTAAILAALPPPDLRERPA